MTPIICTSQGYEYVFTHSIFCHRVLGAIVVLVCPLSHTNQVLNFVGEIMLELNGKPSSVTMSSTNFSFENLVFWNLFEFSAAKIT